MSDSKGKLWHEAHSIAMLPTYDVVALDDMADLIVALVHRVAAEQTAAPREENARLRGALYEAHLELQAFHRNDKGHRGESPNCPTCHLIDRTRDLSIPSLADPERAEEKWRQDREAIKFLADRVGLWANLANLPPDVLAAVERARQP